MYVCVMPCRPPHHPHHIINIINTSINTTDRPTASHTHTYMDDRPTQTRTHTRARARAHTQTHTSISSEVTHKQTATVAIRPRTIRHSSLSSSEAHRADATHSNDHPPQFDLQVHVFLHTLNCLDRLQAQRLRVAPTRVALHVFVQGLLAIADEQLRRFKLCETIQCTMRAYTQRNTHADTHTCNRDITRPGRQPGSQAGRQAGRQASEALHAVDHTRTGLHPQRTDPPAGSFVMGSLSCARRSM